MPGAESVLAVLPLLDDLWHLTARVRYLVLSGGIRAEKVIGRKSMCMMTSNVFGHIAAENLGYGEVELQQTIAEGHPECRVLVYLKPTEGAQQAHGREHVRSVKR